jgi:hypothetical protein
MASLGTSGEVEINVHDVSNVKLLPCNKLGERSLCRGIVVSDSLGKTHTINLFSSDEANLQIRS